MGSGTWRLSGYRIERLLGGGAFGEVWQGTVRSTGAPVALKRIAMNDPGRREYAVSEAAVLTALDHPNLIRLYRLERTEDSIVLVLDLAAGGSLARLLDARGRLTPGEVITTLASVAAALAHAHAARVVHGDVTPANVLFSDAGLPLLADLGVARLVGDCKPVHTTLPYADPVVAAGGFPEPSSDVFMLGAVAVHALTGQPPPSAAGELDPQAWSARVLARLAAADVPGEITAVLARALSLEPHLRGTAGDFALDLRHAGTPTAVELAAGRVRVEPSLARLAAIAAGRPASSGAVPAARGPRHAAPIGSASATTGRSVVGAAAGSSQQPPPGAAPITYGVRLPSPFAAARERSRLRTLLLPLALVLLAGALVAGTLMWWPTSTSAPPPQALPPARTTVPPTSGAGSGQPSARVPADARLDGAQALRVLGTLDAARAAAFAARDPGLLTRVYASPVLLARDRAALAALVPPGCGLRGVRTSFAKLHLVDSTATSLRLTATASLPTSTLVCGAAPAGHAAAAGPTKMGITLIRTADGWRVSAQHPVTT